MNTLHIGENIAKFRKSKGITQDALADFLGVTKASVSKWENVQSYPDVLLIPQIANFFDVTIDCLMGYEPQLAPEQIQKIYQDLAMEFAKKPFPDTVKHTEEFVKQYYSCYPFLIQISILYVNHFMLAPDQKTGIDLLGKSIEICDHIINESTDVELHSQAIMIKALSMLQMGRASEVIELLLPFSDEKGIKAQVSDLMIQAYQQSGKKDSAIMYNELEIYKSILMLVSKNTVSLSLEEEQPDKCMEIISRTEKLIDIYNISALNHNTVALFYYQAALFYTKQIDQEQTLHYLKLFADEISQLFESNFSVGGDEYFSHITDWMKEQGVGELPRNANVILDSAISILSRPEFLEIIKKNDLKHLKEKLESNRLKDN